MITIKTAEIPPRRYFVSYSDDWRTLYSVYTRMRIRQLVITAFVERFGCHPEFHWHKDGFMAEAFGGPVESRQRVTVEQDNNFDQFPANRGFLLPEKCGVAA